MTRPNPSTAMAEALVDELARNGVRQVVASPGSRSAALVIAAAAHPAMETVMVIDERSAAFHALGWAKAAGAPAAVVSTSGTAPANWYPAVVEADMSLTPLILISADRPYEMQGVGANQTIDQVRMFGEKTRLFVGLAAPGVEDLNDAWRSTVCRLVAASRGAMGRPGPVHLNVAFREPTVPVTDDGRVTADPYPHPIDGRAGGAAWAEAAAGPPGPPVEVPYSPRGLVIAGEGAYHGVALLAEAERLGWPVLATALSGLRGEVVIDSYHHLLADGIPERLRPDVVVAVGNVGPSQRLEQLFALATHRVRVDRWGRSIDPGRNTTLSVAADPVATLALVSPMGGADPAWRTSWHDTGRVVRHALDEGVPKSTPSGAGVAAALNLVDWGCLVVGSSLPIREVDAHLTRRGRVVGNRGASGIDGLVSTALGAAAVAPGTVGLAGDLSLLHDGNGYLTDAPVDLVMVVVDNGGGGLFDSLPQSRHAPEYERLFVTPHHRDLGLFAALHGLHHVPVDDLEPLPDAVQGGLDAGGRWLVVVGVKRYFDLATRQALDDIGRSAVASLDP